MTTVTEALENAERLRKEIPQLVQPESLCLHMVALADEVNRLRAWIDDLDVIATYSGQNGRREWHGAEVGWMHPGDVAYFGKPKP